MPVGQEKMYPCIVFGCKHHPLRFNPHQFGRFEVGDHDHLFAYQFVRGVVPGNPCDNRNTIYPDFVKAVDLNGIVNRYAADEGALDYLRLNYSPTGRPGGPVVAPAGAVVVIVLSSTTVKLAPTPLKVSAVALPRFNPLTVTDWPAKPEAGVK